MIHHIEARTGRGGRLAMMVATMALVIVFGALAFVIASPPDSVAAPQSVFSGSFGISTATCPGTSAPVRQTSCDIPVGLAKGPLHAVLTWDTADPIMLALVDSGGRPVAGPTSAKSGHLSLDVADLAAATYVIRITNIDQIGPINFSVGIQQS